MRFRGWQMMAAVTMLTAVALGTPARQAKAQKTFVFQNVVFTDGGTLTGTFTTNDALTTLIDYDITTSPQGVGLMGFPGFHYTPATSTPYTGAGITLPGGFELLNNVGFDPNDLRIIFSGGLTTSGATIATSGNSFELEVTNIRSVISGSVVAVAPEPGSIALVGVGCSVWGVGVLVRKRRFS